MTPCYILKRTFTKVNLLNYPNNLVGVLSRKPDYPQNSISTSPSPFTMTPCYILKRTFTKVNLLNYPNNLGAGCYLANRITTKLHLHFPLPHYNDTMLYSINELLQKLNNLGGCYLANRITTKLHLHFPLPHYNDTVLYSKTNFYKIQPPQLPQQIGGCYLANWITTKLHLHFPLPHYNDTVLYSKTNFYKSQPPQLPQQFGGGVLSRKPDYHKTPSPLPPPPSAHYNDTVLYSKTNFLQKSTSLNYPNNLRGGAISQTGLPQNSISTSPSPITMTPCYILKRTFTKAQQFGGVLSRKPDYHKTPSPLPPPPLQWHRAIY